MPNVTEASSGAALAFFILLAVITIILYVVSQRRKSTPAKSQPTKSQLNVSTPASDSISISMSRTSTSEFQVSPPHQQQDGSWIMNPNCNVHVTLFGIDSSAAHGIWSILEDWRNGGQWAVGHRLEEALTTHNALWKELGDYIDEWKPIYHTALRDAKSAHPDWATASDKDRDDLLVELRKHALDSVLVRPRCDLVTLFECEPSDPSFDDVLVERFGYQDLAVYFSARDRKRPVHKIAADHYHRKSFESLTSKGLALRGSDIPIGSILEVLRLADLNEIAAECKLKKFTRKQQAIDGLVQVPDILDKVGKLVSFRELFMPLELPIEFDSINVDSLSDAWGYLGVYSLLLGDTYMYSARATASLQMFQNIGTKGWNINCHDSSCPACISAASDSTHRSARIPKVPIHIGCTCWISPAY